MKDINKRQEELLMKCISYICEHIESYSDMIDSFKRLGFTEQELIDYDIRDFDFESEVDYEL